MKIAKFSNSPHTGISKLMARVFDSDLLECPRCKSRMQVISFLQDTEAILEILKSLKMSIAPPDIYELEACFIEYEIDQVNGMAGEEIPTILY